MAYALYERDTLLMVSSDRREVRFEVLRILANFFEGLADSDDVSDVSDGLFEGRECAGFSVRVVQRSRL